MTRHGRTARTSISAGDPVLLGEPPSSSLSSSSLSSSPTAALQRSEAPRSSRAGASRPELVALAVGLLVAPTAAQRNRAQAATGVVLDWLEP